MEGVSTKWLEAEEMISKFKADFYEKFQVPVSVNYALDTYLRPQPLIPMQQILDEFDEILKIEYPFGLNHTDKYRRTTIDISEKGIRTKSRIPTIVNYRYLFYRVCVQLGYNYLQISIFIKGSADHSIVIHGCRTFQDRLDTKDREATNIYNKIIPYLNNKYELNLS